MARENIADLLDEGSFTEYGALALAAQRGMHSIEKLTQLSPADGKVMGIGSVNADRFGAGKSRCAVMSYDYTVMGGSLGKNAKDKTGRVLDLTVKWQIPLIIFAEGSGGRPNDLDVPGVSFLNGGLFRAFAQLSGLVPTIGIVTGNCFGGNAALFGMCDVTIATKQASIGMAGPAMIEGGGLGTFLPTEIGPAQVQERNGVIDIVADDEAHATALAKQLLSYFQGVLPQWQAPSQEPLRDVIPADRRWAYPVRRVINVIADEGSFLELQRKFGRSIITGFIRLEGAPVALIANDCQQLGGAIDSEAADKAARFLDLCQYAIVATTGAPTNGLVRRKIFTGELDRF